MGSLTEGLDVALLAGGTVHQHDRLLVPVGVGTEEHLLGTVILLVQFVQLGATVLAILCHRA